MVAQVGSLGSTEDLAHFTTPQLVEQIIQINPTASTNYLHQFARGELREYLEHLLSAQRPRGRDAVWVRPASSHGIVFAEAAD
ncbi:MAG: hypothetical protein U0573_12890 [Phycisphaerales bacterium]|nr:hypothetical protein [Planctomycetota bacterium]